MNSNTVLGKIMTMLSLDDKEIKLTVAKLADGTLVESETFDVGEAVEVIHEDGTKTPAPDGEHLLELRDESDEINRIKIFTEGGIIKERENVEIEAEKEEDKQEELADVSTEEVKALPESGEVEETSEQVTLETEPGIAVDEEVVDKEADEIVNLTTKLEEQEEKIEEMKERIEELVKYFEEIKKEEETLEEEKKEEEELESKKLDGAPIEKPAMFNKKKNNNFKVGNYTNSVLSKMYR